MDLRRVIPFFDPSVQTWAIEARLLRWLTFLWLFIGLAVLFSASYPSGIAKGDGLYYFKRQLLSVVFGLAGFHLLVHTTLRRTLAIATPIFIVLLGLLFATQIPGLGETAYGSTRWLKLGPFPVQPSELLKPFLILQSAQVFSQWERLPWKTRGVWLGIFVIMLGGILIQPSLSTSALCGITLWLTALAAGLPYIQLWGAAMTGLLAAVVSITINPYQMLRITSFMNPWADPARSGYQLIQSLLATGSGGTWGTGFGLSQQKWFYLPFQHTDFIFAVFAEEFGFIGSCLLLLLLTAYGLIALRVAIKAHSPVHQLIAIGAISLMLGQSLFNIGVAIGAMPTTGLPFPLFSYGGNSMIASLLTAGLIIRVARETNEVEAVSPAQSENSPSYSVVGNGVRSFSKIFPQSTTTGKPNSSSRRQTDRRRNFFSRRSNLSNGSKPKPIDPRANRRSRPLRPPIR